jgi:hypothetical protein
MPMWILNASAFLLEWDMDRDITRLKLGSFGDPTDDFMIHAKLQDFTLVQARYCNCSAI